MFGRYCSRLIAPFIRGFVNMTIGAVEQISQIPHNDNSSDLIQTKISGEVPKNNTNFHDI
jgi:hypothetical protein